MTYIKSRTGSKFGQIPPRTEIAALERLKIDVYAFSLSGWEIPIDLKWENIVATLAPLISLDLHHSCR